MLVRGEELHQFYLIYSDMENKNTYLTVDYILKGLAWYFPCEFSLKKVCNAPLYKKPRNLKMRCYAARSIDLNDYLVSFTGEIMADKIGVTEINEII